MEQSLAEKMPTDLTLSGQERSLPPARSWAYRVGNIPAAMTREELLAQFVPEDQPYIQIRSLVPSASQCVQRQSPTEEKWLCCKLTATVSFTKKGAFKDGPNLRYFPHSNDSRPELLWIHASSPISQT